MVTTGHVTRLAVTPFYLP